MISQARSQALPNVFQLQYAALLKRKEDISESIEDERSDNEEMVDCEGVEAEDKNK